MVGNKDRFNPNREETAYCSVTYLWSFTRAELGLPEDATNEELERAADARMEQITNLISMQADVFPNDIEVSIA